MSVHTLLSAVEERPVLWRLADLDHLQSVEELHYESAGYDRGDAELHERAPVRGHDHAHPVEGVCCVRRHYAEQGDLHTQTHTSLRSLTITLMSFHLHKVYYLVCCTHNTLHIDISDR